jgi:lantibiotic biosynthesis protein
MKKENFPKLFDKVVIRITSIPFVKNINQETFFSDIQKNAFFLKAVYHSNPLVYNIAMDWFSGKLIDKRKIEKIKHTLYNYYTRMYSNGVPYGFFSSTTALNWSETGSLVTLNEYKQSVRLDMGLLYTIVEYFNRFDFVLSELLFYTNNTIYEIGNQYRYIETFDNGGKIGYKISGVESSTFLTSIFVKAKEGVRIADLADELKDEEYPFETIYEFLMELVSAKLLIPETQLNISGPDAFDRIYSILTALPVKNKEEFDIGCNVLTEIRGALTEFKDKADIIYTMEGIKKLVKRLGLEVLEKFCLQVDNFSILTDNQLSQETVEKLNAAVFALSCFNQNNYKPFIENFKSKFSEKYEDASIPLMQAIDTEAGISFGEFAFENDNPLLNNLVFGDKQNEYLSRSIQGDKLRGVLYARYWEACRKNEYTIKFYEHDFNELDGKVAQLAPNYQILFQVVDASQHLLYLRTAGNSSGGALISRFAYASGVLNSMLSQAAQFEKEFYSDCIVAEIVHISDHRLGNITFRPIFRDYELPILNRSMMVSEFQVHLADIMVTVKGGKIILWSQKLKKRIIPMLTNAHNYSMNTAPVYQFLCEVSFQDHLPSLYMDRAELPVIGIFVPRIQFENVILYPATWRFEKKDLTELLETKDSLTSETILEFKEKWRLPEYTVVLDGGSNILVQWTSVLSVYYFIKTILNKTDSVFLEEYLFDFNNTLVKDKNGSSYFSECLALANNTIKQKESDYNNIAVAPDPLKTERKFYPGDNWMYLKFYCGNNTADKILRNEIPELLDKLQAEKLISKFFFIRFNDPNYHIRLRFKVNSNAHQKILQICRQQLDYYFKNDLIWKLQEDTYTRELERYGYEGIDFAESIFEADSMFVIKLMKITDLQFTDAAPYLFIKGTDLLLDGFNYSLNEKKHLLLEKKNAYASEFNVGKKDILKEGIIKKEIENRKFVEKIINGNYAGTPIDFDSELLNQVFSVRKQEIQKIYSEHSDILHDRNAIDSMVSSFIHMYSIRMFQDKPRPNELVCYHLLHSFYHKSVNMSSKI